MGSPLGPMSVHIFLSTVSDEFLAYRDQLRRDLTRHNVEVKVQEDFKEYGGSTLDMLDQYIAECDAVIHLVGDMTGSAPSAASVVALLAKYPKMLEKLPPLRALVQQGHDISYTQWEAWLALYHNKLLLIAEADQAAPRGPSYAPTDESRAAQKEHVQRLRGFERYSRSFTSPDNLAKIILGSAILDLLTKAEHPEGLAGLRSLPYPAIIAILFLLLLAPLAGDELAKTLGVSLATPLVLAGAVGGVALALMYWRYLGILGSGAEAADSLERKNYDALRQSLATGGAAVRLYSRWLTAFLDWIDRFFGDAGMADRTLFPHAFGLRTPAPLWTAASFDRCLLLALIYPIVTIFVMWAVSGHVGPAEQAFGVGQNLLAWQRMLGLAVVGLAAFAMCGYSRSKGWKSLIWIAVTVALAAIAISINMTAFGSFLLAINYLIVVVGGFATAWAVAFADRRLQVGARNVAFNVAGVACISFAVALALKIAANSPDGVLNLSIAITAAFAGPGDVAVVVAVLVLVAWTLLAQMSIAPYIFVVPLFSAVAVASAFVVAVLRTAAIRRRRDGIFLSALLAVVILVCLVAARTLPRYLGDWNGIGPALLFLGLLTLLNAPFDWLSLGVTRALLRRGLELRGWWPYLLALVDALTAAGIIAVLALTMVVGVQAFDDLSVRGGGHPALPLQPLFDGIAAHPGSPEFWWIYVLLLSTMAPSLINLMIGGTALVRAVPGVPSLLLSYLPADRAVPAYDRAWIALVLTLQVAGGIVIAFAAQALLAVGLIFYAMPSVGLGLLDLARTVAAFDLPGRILAVF